MKLSARRLLSWSAGFAAALSTGAAHAAIGNPELPFARLALGLILCSIVALLAALALRRFMRGGGPRLAGLAGILRDPGRQVSVLETHQLSPHADVCRLASGDKEYLVIVSPGAATVLDSKPSAPAPTQTP